MNSNNPVHISQIRVIMFPTNWSYRGLWLDEILSPFYCHLCYLNYAIKLNLLSHYWLNNFIHFLRSKSVISFTFTLPTNEWNGNKNESHSTEKHEVRVALDFTNFGHDIFGNLEFDLLWNIIRIFQNNFFKPKKSNKTWNR